LSLESYFHLLEHEELQEARRASRDALGKATLAIRITLFVAASRIREPIADTFL